MREREMFITENMTPFQKVAEQGNLRRRPPGLPLACKILLTAGKDSVSDECEPQQHSLAPRSQVQCLLAVANRLNGTIRRALIRVRGKSSPCRMLLHHCGWGSRKARGDAESMPRAPP